MTDSLFPPPSGPVPPSSPDEEISWLQLIRSYRVGPATFQRLLGEYGSAPAALAALPGIAAAAGVRDYRPASREAAEEEYAHGRDAGARLICLGQPAYPTRLAGIPDAPPLVWAIGDTGLLQRRTIAIVGARNASGLGTRMARRLSGELGQSGYVIASGLARGIDTASHMAALETGTIAVLAGGVDQVYPKENLGLYDDMRLRGLVLSEQPIGLYAQARHFPRRNRLISGLAQAVVMVEGAAKSGSMITAQTALEQGRDVLAVPGHPLDPRVGGCNILIRDGATLVRSSKDVLEALARPAQERPANPGPKPAPAPKATIPEALEISRRILSLLGPSPIPEDLLIREMAIPAEAIAPELVTLELDGKLRRQAGGMLSLVV